MTLITLLSDFGLEDQYVSQMKAVILSTVPQAQIVDISHRVERHNVTIGSYLLETTAPLFPKGSIHVAVVDPGVGGNRSPIVVRCERGILVGPDNGLLVNASRRLGFKAAYRIDNRRFMRTNISNTFHGRDVFAKAAAEIAKGSDLRKVGSIVSKLVRLRIPEVSVSKNGLTCTVLYIDSFGNIVTNVPEELVQSLPLRYSGTITVGGPRQRNARAIPARSYLDIPLRKVGIVVGSQGYLEIALREGSAADKLKVKVADRVDLRFN